MNAENKSAIELIEVAPRDGLQNQAETLTTDDKVHFIESLIRAGARRIEIASFVNPKLVPQMADAEAVTERVAKRPGVTRIGLVLNERGLERALATDIEEIGALAVATDAFGVRNQKQTCAESVAVAKSVIARAKAAGRSAQATISVAFGCPFEGEVPLSRIVAVAASLAEAGPREIALADTIGAGVPAQVEGLIAAVGKAVPGMALRCHFHNTRNTGLANAWAAYQAGVARLDASMGGIGGCPFAPQATGNIATEDLVYLFERSGIATGYDLGALIALAPWLAERLDMRALPALVSRAGSFPPKQRALA
jgi:hydroxymethylglutaryl-CoA lyase